MGQGFEREQDSRTECKVLNYRVGRPRSYEWLAKGPSWFPGVHEGELGVWDFAKSMFTKTDRLLRINAVIKRIKGPQSGALAFGPLDVFFVPGTEFLPGRDENGTVSLYLGFSYEGLSRWSVSRTDRGADS